MPVARWVSSAASAAWPILVYGLPTLPMRLKGQYETAMTIARFLEEHPKVQRVRYPGLESFPQHALAREQKIILDGHATQTLPITPGRHHVAVNLG